MRQKKHYKVAAIFDTETTNIKKYDKHGYVTQNETRAICILYIFNDVRNIWLQKYEPERDDKVSFIRHEKEALAYIDEIIEWGIKNNYTPIICAYNLMFDMQTLMFDLNMKYDMKANAQSSTNVYTLDLMDSDGVVVLRFWDTYHLEMRGLSAMGETCGLGKATGSWDYSLIRTSETPLTDEELYYAKRDVQVIPAYLKYLLNANDWLKEWDLGCKVITKTSLVRQMAQRRIGQIRVIKRDGKQLTLMKAFEALCRKELPKTYRQYALRKACFRGGWTFTSGVCASRVIQNVCSLDVTSMHHAFINGRYVPVEFSFDNKEILQLSVENVLSQTTENVLANYYKPFSVAFHMQIKFTNIRLKKGTCFDDWQIALIPTGKFRTIVSKNFDYGSGESQIAAEESIRSSGYHDSCINPIFAFGKMYSADSCALFLSELELWCISQVYEWDSLEPLQGETTVKFVKPPDYVTLQSNTLFEMKNAAKIINKNYKEGIPYDGEIPNTIPEGISKGLRSGTISNQFFEAYYNSTVKGMFNGIYGTMAQDVFKPDYTVQSGEIFVNRETTCCEANFDERKPRRCKVLYNYGLRIVGGSRMHLVIAMQLLYAKFGNRITVSGGDTDSLKIRLDKDVRRDDLLETLQPLHEAIKNAIDFTQKRLRETQPEQASDLKNIGVFDCEDCGGDETWLYHMEGWNKARVSISQDLKPHVTCAGLSRPEGEYHIESFISDLIQNGISPEKLLPNVIGYNVYITHEICHALEHRKPDVKDVYDDWVMDYLGNKVKVCQTEAIALYESGRMLGDTNKRTNVENVRYLKKHGVNVNDSEKWVCLKDGKPMVLENEEIIYG